MEEGIIGDVGGGDNVWMERKVWSRWEVVGRARRRSVRGYGLSGGESGGGGGGLLLMISKTV